MILYDRMNTGRSRDMELFLCDRDVHITPGSTYGPVVRDLYIVECCTGGRGGVQINGTYFPLKGGECYFLMPGDIIVHSADMVEPRRGVWCAVDGFMIREYLLQTGITSEQPFAPPEVFEAINACIEEMLAIREDNDAGAPLRRSGLVNKLFGELLRCAAKGESRYAQQAMRIMEARYDQPIHMEDIAREIGLERSYFSTVFKQETGMTPHRYLKQLRIKKACSLITDGSYRIGEAALAVGIAPESFSRAFYDEMHTTPGEYLQQKKNGIR